MREHKKLFLYCLVIVLCGALIVAPTLIGNWIEESKITTTNVNYQGVRMKKQYITWSDDLLYKAVREAMKQIGTEKMPTQTQLRDMDPIKIGLLEISGAAINNRIAFQGGFKEVAEFMHIETKGRGKK